MNTPDRNSKPAKVKTILILDGDVLVRMPVVQFLRDCGYQAVEAANTDEAMAILQKTNVPVDVVLSEIDIEIGRFLRNHNYCSVDVTPHKPWHHGSIDDPKTVDAINS